MDLSRITAEALLRFVSEQARSHQPASVGVLTYSLRTFLRCNYSVKKVEEST